MRQCRRSKGYLHWGMINAYGEIHGSGILRRIDREIHLEVLRSPVNELLNEMQMNAVDLNPASLSSRRVPTPRFWEQPGREHLQFVCETLGSMVSYENRFA